MYYPAIWVSCMTRGGLHSHGKSKVDYIYCISLSHEARCYVILFMLSLALILLLLMKCFNIHEGGVSGGRR
jgi:hypothetical protein